MALAILAPVQPHLNGFPLWPSFMPTPWVIFMNSVVLFLFVPLALFFFNLVHVHVRFPHSFLGYPMSVTKAKETFVWPLEKLVDGKRKLVYIPKDFDVDEELEKFERAGITDIWVTPKVPFMIPLLAGFIATFLVGDILVTLMNSITSWFI